MALSMRKAHADDVPALKALWAEAFGDAPDYIDLYFSRRFSPDETYLLTDDTDGIILSTLTAMPVSLLRESAPPIDGRYIYAVATPSVYRGLGYAKLLHALVSKALRQEGAAFTCLVPAEESLHRFYASIGYTEWFPVYTGTVKQETAFQSDFIPDTADPVEFTALRAEYLHRLTRDKTPLFHPPVQLQYIYEELTACEGKVFTASFDQDDKRCYAAVLLPDSHNSDTDTLYIRETSADPVRMAAALLTATGRDLANIRHAYPFPGAVKVPYGMIYWLDDPEQTTPLKEGYMALMLD